MRDLSNDSVSAWWEEKFVYPETKFEREIEESEDGGCVKCASGGTST
jgi:hypothetical protein